MNYFNYKYKAVSTALLLFIYCGLFAHGDGMFGVIDPEVIRGPYLQKGTESSVVIKWRTDIPSGSEVKWGTSVGVYNNVILDPILKTDHEIEITGLASATTYYYEIIHNGIVLVPGATDLYFKTHPAVGSTDPIRAWILGDPGTANQDQRDVRDAYYNYAGSSHTDMILFLGDNAYNNGIDAQYQNAMFENMYEGILKNTIAWSTLGNHDGITANSSTQTGPYYDIFTFPKAGESGGEPSGTEAYYSFDHGNVHFIILDSNESPREMNGAMYNWAETDIQGTSQKWIVALFHHPPYTKGSHNSDNIADSGGRLKDMRENFLPLLEDNGVDLVLSGHSHSYERSFFINGHYGLSTTFDPNTNIVTNGNGDGKADGDGEYMKGSCNQPMKEGAIYITTGSAGKITGNGSLDHPSMYYSRKDLGSAVLEVEGDELTVKFVRPSGAIDDYFTILKSDEIIGAPCDDGFSCTTNDVYDSLCDCAGTPLDSDGDTIDDCNDACPLDPNKIFPGICGCGVPETDTDGDGFEDCIDNCPMDAAKTELGICGCGVPETNTDSDGDGFQDCIDNCPTDAAKTEPGICGCGVSEIDTDGDGFEDCIDNCPTDVTKTAPGTCGCGDPETDTDGDGFPDCIDNCPTDPFKTNPGLCGCGVADLDNDGICDDVDDCVLVLDVDQSQMTTGLFEAIETVTSDAIINSGLNVNFSAGNEVVLRPDFEVKGGVTFHAFIQGCTN